MSDELALVYVRDQVTGRRTSALRIGRTSEGQVRVYTQDGKTRVVPAATVSRARTSRQTAPLYERLRGRWLFLEGARAAMAAESRALRRRR